MTLEDAIEYYDNLADWCCQKADIERNDYMDLRDESAECRQLADWLNELKWLREKIQSQTEPFNPCIICQEFDCSGCKFKR